MTRRARLEGRRAGRAAGLGRPLAESLEQLPGRLWIRHRFDEFVGEAERQLVTRRREINEQVEVQQARLQELEQDQTFETDRLTDLGAAHDKDRAKPRHQQNLALEYELASARERLRNFTAREHELAIDLARQKERLHEIDREFTAQPTRLHASCASVQREHDIEYARSLQAWYVAALRRLFGVPGARRLVRRAEA